MSANIMTMRGADGTRSNPIPLSMGEEIEKMAESFDGAGNKTQTVLNDFGSKIAETDALNNTSIIERDGNNNPTKLTDRRAVETVYSYDNRGNTLTSTIDNETTSYSYESTFNQ